MQALIFSIKSVYVVVPLLSVAIALTFFKTTLPVRNLIVVTIFSIGFIALAFHLAIKWWILRSAIAVGTTGPLAEVFGLACVAMIILGFRMILCWDR